MSVKVGEEYKSQYTLFGVSGMLYPKGTGFKVVYLDPTGVSMDAEVDDGSIAVFNILDFLSSCTLIQPTLPTGATVMTGMDVWGKEWYSDLPAKNHSTPICECGQRGVSYAIHSDYCPLYIKIAKI